MGITERVNFMMTPAELAVFDEWWKGKGYEGRSVALRWLIRDAIDGKSDAEGWLALADEIDELRDNRTIPESFRIGWNQAFLEVQKFLRKRHQEETR